MTGRRILGLALVGIIACLLLYESMPDGTSFEGVPPDAPQEVRDAMARLRSSRPMRRAEAARQLARMDGRAGPSVPLLVALLTDDEDGAGWTEKLLRTIHPLAGPQPVWGSADHRSSYRCTLGLRWYNPALRSGGPRRDIREGFWPGRGKVAAMACGEPAKVSSWRLFLVSLQ